MLRAPVDWILPSTVPSINNSLLNLTVPLIETPLDSRPPFFGAVDERLDCSPVVDLAGSRPGCGASGLRLENICIVLIPPGLPFCKADLVPRLQRIWNSEKPWFISSPYADFSQRATGARTLAHERFDSGDETSADRFLCRKSDATSALDHHCRSSGRIHGNHAGPRRRARPQDCHVLSAEYATRFAHPYGHDFPCRSGNGHAARRHGWQIDHRDANSSSFCRGDRSSRVAGCKDSGHFGQRRPGAQSRRSTTARYGI